MGLHETISAHAAFSSATVGEVIFAVIVITYGPPDSAYCSDTFIEGASCDNALRSIESSWTGRRILLVALGLELDALDMSKLVLGKTGEGIELVGVLVVLFVV